MMRLIATVLILKKPPGLCYRIASLVTAVWVANSHMWLIKNISAVGKTAVCPCQNSQIKDSIKGMILHHSPTNRKRPFANCGRVVLENGRLL
ncbi:MAG: hypothetical protein GY943_28515 [Chloroflexi bacterium]|nr:hypothetical protein [Chloroflexota bacterium]